MQPSKRTVLKLEPSRCFYALQVQQCRDPRAPSSSSDSGTPAFNVVLHRFRSFYTAARVLCYVRLSADQRPALGLERVVEKTSSENSTPRLFRRETAQDPRKEMEFFIKFRQGGLVTGLPGFLYEHRFSLTNIPFLRRCITKDLVSPCATGKLRVCEHLRCYVAHQHLRFAQDVELGHNLKGAQLSSEYSKLELP